MPYQEGTVLVAKYSHRPRSYREHGLRKHDILIAVAQTRDLQSPKWTLAILAADINSKPAFVPTASVFAVPDNYMTQWDAKQCCPFCNEKLAEDEGFAYHMLTAHSQLHQRLDSVFECTTPRATSFVSNDQVSSRSLHPDFGPSHETRALWVVVTPESSVPFPLSEDSLGYWRGIQGENNSCYIDALIFALFARKFDFDTLFERRNSIPLIAALEDEIVKPLRTRNWVSRETMYKWRQKLNEYLPGNDFSGTANEERDVEQFLSTLFSLAAQPPYLRYYIGDDVHHVHTSMFHQIFITERPKEQLVTVQRLLELSFRESGSLLLSAHIDEPFAYIFICDDIGVKLLEVPEYLIVFMPRYGANFKLCDYIVPSETIRVRTLLHADLPERKNVVGPMVSTFENVQQACARLTELFLRNFCSPFPLALGSIFSAGSYQPYQYNVMHDSEDYNFLPASSPQGPETLFPTEHCMRLEAMLTIERSHYVAWVRDGAKVLFFDSMADRVDPVNVPQVREARDVAWMLETHDINEAMVHDAPPNGDLRRVLKDLNMCIYKKCPTG